MSTATSKVRTALVIGGGIAGPVAATALLKAGLQATVYEAYPTLAEGIGGGLALAPNGLAALGIIGADDAVRALATPITGTVMAVGGKTRRLPSLAGVEPLQVIGRGDEKPLVGQFVIELEEIGVVGADRPAGRGVENAGGGGCYSGAQYHSSAPFFHS